MFKATIYDGERILGTGHAFEEQTSTFINKTSYIENCETSAVGRALGMCGFGIDTSVASAEEVENAINNQNKTDYRIEFIKLCKLKGINASDYAKEHGITKATTQEEYKKVVESLKADTEAIEKAWEYKNA
jgi:galactitol-specific phosphotransferase system IIB component